jgi:hypothetical protein
MNDTTTGPGATGITPSPAAGVMARQEFGAQSLVASGETAAAALAARERAMVEARFIMAMRRPRDWDDVRRKLLDACERPGFAGSATEKVWGAAWYRKPVGDGAEGFSIRFAEEAQRAMGNIDVLPATVYEDDRKRIVTVMVLDLETNNGHTTTLTVDKTVERKKLPKGEVPLRTRTNSYGEPVYLLPATQDEVYSLQQNYVSKATRTGILRILLGDIQAECRTRILAIRHGEAAKDPGKLRRQIADGFAALNVSPSQLKEYLGHDLASCTPAELVDLRDLWEGLKEGKTTWAEVMAAVRDERGESPGSDAPGEKPKSGLDAAAERLRAQAAANAPAAQPPVAVTTDAPKDCPHEKVPPLSLKPGTSTPCPDCGTVLDGEPVSEEAAAPPKVAGFRPTPAPPTAPADAPPSGKKGQRTLAPED